jgi:hypothetical protein
LAFRRLGVFALAIIQSSGGSCQFSLPGPTLVSGPDIGTHLRTCTDKQMREMPIASA